VILEYDFLLLKQCFADPGLTSLAYLEMRLILAKILWNFDLSLQPECKHWNIQKVNLLWSKGPLMVKLTPVERVETIKTG
jgi:hypothetical protein